MKPSTAVLTGIFLILLTAIPIASVEGMQPQRTVDSSVGDCRGVPFDRPVPSEVKNPAVIGTVQQVPNNSSRIQINFTVVQESPNATLHIDMQRGGKIVEAQRVSVEDENRSHVSLDTHEFSIIYTLASPMEGISYTYGKNWIFAPTPDFGGAKVALEPRDNGFIGQNILYMGEYSIQSDRAGCQNISIIKPAHANFDAEKRLKVLTYSAHALEVGQAYTSVYVFASTKEPGSRAGMVPEYENDIFLYGPAPLDKAENLWIHEYIHTRQARYLEKSNNFGWFPEATANYYAARLSLELGLITPREYNAQIAQWNSYQPSVTLRNAKHENVSYKHGAVVLAELDAKLSEKGHTTLLDIFYDLNNGYSTNYEEFESKLASDGKLNETRINQTRAVVWGKKNPDPNNAYIDTKSWLPSILRSSIHCIKGFVLVIGVVLILFGIYKYLSDGPEPLSKVF